MPDFLFHVVLYSRQIKQWWLLSLLPRSQCSTMNFFSGPNDGILFACERTAWLRHSPTSPSPPQKHFSSRTFFLFQKS